MSEKKTAPVEEMEFKAEVKQMLDIVIHSLYTDRQIFVRELISNASDALEKMRLKKLLNDTAPAEGELEIQIETNEEANTFIIRDNGIGMTKKELIDNLGTIARSGSKNFIEQRNQIKCPRQN
jgi:molecular chaperone HtpG